MNGIKTISVLILFLFTIINCKEEKVTDLEINVLKKYLIKNELFKYYINKIGIDSNRITFDFRKRNVYPLLDTFIYNRCEDLIQEKDADLYLKGIKETFSSNKINNFNHKENDAGASLRVYLHWLNESTIYCGVYYYNQYNLKYVDFIEYQGTSIHYLFLFKDSELECVLSGKTNS